MLRIFLKLIFWAILIFIGISSYFVYYYTRDLPDYSYLANYHPPASTRLYSIDGKLLEEYALEHRIFVSIKAIPQLLINAFISAEDHNFFEHKGIDIFGITRASINNIFNLLYHKKVEGGSTITQQVVKNFLLNPSQTLERKIKEVLLSYIITKAFTKEQILELYLNQIFLGKGAYGVAAAAQIYFNKSIDDITLAEAAFLAGLPKAPSNYNPEKYYEKSKARRDYVIMRMLENGYISNEEAESAINIPIVLRKRDKEETIKADYYAEQVRSEIIKQFDKDFFYTGGLTVITSLHTEYQKSAEKAFRDGIRNFDIQKGYRGPITNISIQDWHQNLQNIPNPTGLLDFHLAVILNITNQKIIVGLKTGEEGLINLKATNWIGHKIKLKKGDVIIVEKLKKELILQQIPEVNGAILVMNPHTGQVFAMVGGYDYDNSKFNRATQAQRQPGSLIKPFIYLAALEKGIPPNAIFNDGPITLSQGPGMPLWRPKNYKGDFLGDITMRSGLEKSRNLVTIRVALRVGIEGVVEIINRFGIHDAPNRVFSIVLGALETTLLKMVSAYSVLVNGGYAIKPNFIELIQDRNGNIIYKRDNSVCTNCLVKNLQQNNIPEIIPQQQKQIVNEAKAYQMVSMLLGVVQRGTAAKAKGLGHVGGKTGSTNDSMDTWFVGFSHNLIVGTYVGYDMPKTLGKSATGNSVALPIFIHFMKLAVNPEETLPFKIPNTIKIVNVDPKTGVSSNNPGFIEEAFEAEANQVNDLKQDSDGIEKFIPNSYKLDEVY